MTSEVPRVVPIDARHAQKRNKMVGLSECERQLLLDEIAQIAAELNELQRRAAQIAGRVARDDAAPAQPSPRADRSA
jgi:hypothetical protein